MSFYTIASNVSIGLLFLYCLAEVMRFKKLNSNKTWFGIKAFLVIFGFLMALFTLRNPEVITGSLAPQLMAALVETHSLWVTLTLWTFGFLAACYVVLALTKFDIVSTTGEASHKRLFNGLHTAASFVVDTLLVYLFIIQGVFSLIITISIAGAISYGETDGRITRFVINLTGNTSTLESSQNTTNITITYVTLTKELVAEHDFFEDCWVIANNRVYFLTRYLLTDPEGRYRITKVCGQDGTREFTGEHQSDRTDILIERYYIGNLGDTISEVELQNKLESLKP